MRTATDAGSTGRVPGRGASRCSPAACRCRARARSCEPQVSAAADDVPGISFDPRPPQAGDSAAEIVAGFLEAMKATPISTTVARQFLSEEAADSWVPEQQIITYAELGTAVGETSVRIPLSEVNRYDARGAWQRTAGRGPARRSGWRSRTASGASTSCRRPDRPGLVVRRRLPARLALLLRPHGPGAGARARLRAERRAVRLLARAGARWRSPTTSRPTWRRPTSRPGRARGPRGPDQQRGHRRPWPSPGTRTPSDDETAQRMLAQLVWTLRQEPRIRAVELSIGGRALGGPGGSTQVNLDVGSAYDPNGVRPSAELYALDRGLLVSGEIGAFEPTDGPLGTVDLGVRSVGGGPQRRPRRRRHRRRRGPAGRTGPGGGGGRRRGRSSAPSTSPRRAGTTATGSGCWTAGPAGRGSSWWSTAPRGRSTSRASPAGRPGRCWSRATGAGWWPSCAGPGPTACVSTRVRQDAAGAVLGATRVRTLPRPTEGSPRIRDIGWRSPTAVVGPQRHHRGPLRGPHHLRRRCPGRGRERRHHPAARADPPAGLLAGRRQRGLRRSPGAPSPA